MKQVAKTSKKAKSQALQALRIMISAANLAEKQGISATFSWKQKNSLAILQQNNENQPFNPCNGNVIYNA